MSCPYFKEGYFGICVAPDAVHVPSIAEMETLCFKTRYAACPNFADITASRAREKILVCPGRPVRPLRRARSDFRKRQSG
jgi:hypothetical protein